MTKPVIFISCGQAAPEEAALGRAIARLVDELTPYAGYFAANQHSLDGVAENILRALGRARGFIGILHQRGSVATRSGTTTRGSVWVEQELAIAAYIRHVEGISLLVKTFVHRDIAREGLREFVILNPTQFGSHDEILESLRAELPTWQGFIDPRAVRDPALVATMQICRRWRGEFYDRFPKRPDEVAEADGWEDGVQALAHGPITAAFVAGVWSSLGDPLAGLVTDLYQVASASSNGLPADLRRAILEAGSPLISEARRFQGPPRPIDGADLLDHIRVRLIHILLTVADIDRTAERLRAR